MRRAPKLPPKLRMTVSVPAFSLARAAARSWVNSSGRTGLPTTMVFWGAPSFSTAAALAAMTRSTSLASSLLVTPGKAFCSWMAVWMPRLAAARTMGPLT